MICVYPADCTDFSTNGNGTLAPLSAEVTETLIGEYELTLVHVNPVDALLGISYNVDLTDGAVG